MCPIPEYVDALTSNEVGKGDWQREFVLFQEELAITPPVNLGTNTFNPSGDDVENTVLDVGGRPIRMEVHSEAAAHATLRVAPIIAVVNANW
jgi:hypothetical protein